MTSIEFEKQLEYPFSDDNEEDDKRDEEDEDVEITDKLDELALETSIFSSYLKKKSLRNKNWKKRWFVLRATRLSYYKNDQEYELHNIIQLESIHAIGRIDAKHKAHAFGIVVPDRTFYLQADSEELLENWIAHLQKAIKALNLSLPRAPIKKSPLFISQARPQSLRESIFTNESLLTSSSQPQDLNGEPNLGYIDDCASAQIESPFSPIDSELMDREGISIIAQEQKNDQILKQGYIFRLKGLPKTWKKYWCVLRTHSFTLYKDEKEYEVRFLIPISQILSVHHIDSAPKKTRDHCFKIVYGTKTWILSTDGDQETMDWINALNSARQNEPVDKKEN